MSRAAWSLDRSLDPVSAFLSFFLFFLVSKWEEQISNVWQRLTRKKNKLQDISFPNGPFLCQQQLRPVGG